MGIGRRVSDILSPFVRMNSVSGRSGYQETMLGCKLCLTGFGTRHTKGLNTSPE